MRIAAFFAPYIAFIFSALAGIAFHKSWAGTLCASVIFFGATYLVFGAIRILAEKNYKK
jgi:hypothetical protein